MSEPARKSFALDLDDLERQLRQAAQPARPGQSVDPLVELTRIVGTDDPLKDLFAQPRQVGQSAPRSQPTQVWPQQEAETVPAAAPPAEVRGALDEFEALLRRTDAPRPTAAASAAVPVRHEPAFHDDAAYHQPQSNEHGFEVERHEQEPQAWTPPARPLSAAQARDLDEGRSSLPYVPDDPDAYHDDNRLPDGILPDEPVSLEPRRSRRGLWAAAALIAVGAIGVGSAMMLRGGSTPVAGDGTPPLIAADTGPVKVAPENPGGTEIPNQNKQIYERSPDAPRGPTRVVTREEQAVDVQQAARTMAVEASRAGGPATSTNPLAQAPVAPTPVAQPSAEPGLIPVPPIPGLGEPRRVRTVTIRPDGSPVTEPTQVASAAPSPMTTGSAPRAGATPQAANPPQAAPVRQPERAAPATTPQATPPVRVAAAAPTPAVSATPAPATAAVRAGTGDFAVQLGAPGSEAEARAAFSALQRKYSQLGGLSPIVRKTDLAGGKTVYRLRVGPFSREDATSMCSQLQAAGGQCFVARN